MEVIEQTRCVQARAGGKLGDRWVGSGDLEAAGAAAIDEFEREAIRPQRCDRGAASFAEFTRRAPFQRAQYMVLQRLTGDRVLQSRDLPFVAHQAGQLQGTAPGGNRPGQGQGGGRCIDGRAAHAEVDAGMQGRAIEIDRKQKHHVERGSPGGDRFELRVVVDHQDNALSAQELPGDGIEIGRVDCRIRHDQIIKTLSGEPGGFPARIAQQALEARRQGLHAAQHFDAAHRFRTEPDRQATGAMQHRARVHLERVEIQHSRRQWLAGNRLCQSPIALGAGIRRSERLTEADRLGHVHGRAPRQPGPWPHTDLIRNRT